MSTHNPLAVPGFTASLIVPGRGRVTMSKQGQPMVSLVNGLLDGNLPGCQFCIGQVRMLPLGFDDDGRPVGVSNAHVHYDTDVAVFLVSAGPAGAITRKGPLLEDEVHQKPGELVVIPRGEPHVALNPDPDHDVIALEFRARPSIDDDNNLCPDLQHLALEAHGKLLADATAASRPATADMTIYPFAEHKDADLGRWGH